MKGKSVRGILSVLLALVIVFGLLPMGTPTSFADGVVIDIGTVSEGGTGYTYAGNKVTITTDGSYTLTGTTTTNKVIVASGVVANITLDAVSIDVSKESYFAPLHWMVRQEPSLPWQETMSSQVDRAVRVEGPGICTSDHWWKW